MSEQPKALRLADAIDYPDVFLGIESAAELRRLHKVEKQRNELLKVLQSVMAAHGEQLDVAFEQAQDAIEKAKGETQ